MKTKFLALTILVMIPFTTLIINKSFIDNYPEIHVSVAKKFKIDIPIDPKINQRFILKQNRLLVLNSDSQLRKYSFLLYVKYLQKTQKQIEPAPNSLNAIDLCENGLMYISNSHLIYLDDWGRKIWETELKKPFHFVFCTKDGAYLTNLDLKNVWFYDRNIDKMIQIETKINCENITRDCKMDPFHDYSNRLIIFNEKRGRGLVVDLDEEELKLKKQDLSLPEGFNKFASSSPVRCNFKDCILLSKSKKREIKLKEYLEKEGNKIEREQREILERVLLRNPEEVIYSVKVTYWIVDLDGNIIGWFHHPSSIAVPIAISSDKNGSKLVFMVPGIIGEKEENKPSIAFLNVYYE